MKVAIRTLGCKLNRFESEALAERLRAAGHQVVPFDGEAEFYLVNTCTVTSVADAECRKVIRRVAREHPGAAIGAVGCYAERDREALASLPGVRLVLGTRDKNLLPGHLEALAGNAPAPSGEGDLFPRIGAFAGRTRAFVKIQDGCDRRCSYCVVWRVRGANRSADPGGIVGQVARLGKAGHREVVLTGVHLGSWGRDLSPPRALADLLRELCAVPQGPRIRLSSIEPGDIDGRLIGAVASGDRICRHFHIPLQSGSDRVLGLMNRGYRAPDFHGVISRLTEAFPGAGLGTDIIAGFPGETEEDFESTMALVRELPFTYLHVFTYSRRPGTPAAEMPGQVPREVREERSARLRELGRRKAEDYRRGFIGREVSCLVESERDRSTGLLKGVSGEYLKILFPGPDGLRNTFVGVTVERVEGKETHGRITS